MHEESKSEATIGLEQDSYCHVSEKTNDTTSVILCTDEPQKDSQNLTAQTISITDEHHKLSNTTSSLVDESYSNENRSNISSDNDKCKDTIIEADTLNETEDDSLMRRNIDSLHQSISNMRDEFLER